MYLYHHLYHHNTNVPIPPPPVHPPPPVQPPPQPPQPPPVQPPPPIPTARFCCIGKRSRRTSQLIIPHFSRHRPSRHRSVTSPTAQALLCPLVMADSSCDTCLFLTRRIHLTVRPKPPGYFRRQISHGGCEKPLGGVDVTRKCVFVGGSSRLGLRRVQLPSRAWRPIIGPKK